MEFYPSVFGHIEVRTDPRSPRKLRRRPTTRVLSLRREVFQTPGPLALELRMPAGRDPGRRRPSAATRSSSSTRRAAATRCARRSRTRGSRSGRAATVTS